MLTQDQENYLNTLPTDVFISITPPNPRCKEIAQELIATARSRYPDIEARFLGAAALGISGVNDVDLDFMVSPLAFPAYLETFKELFGEPRDTSADSAVWTFFIEGIEIDMWLSNPDSESSIDQWKKHQLLAGSTDLIKQYEEIKLACNGKSYQEYVRAKYQFFDGLHLTSDKTV